MTPTRIGIIGGGFSGAITAVHLLRAQRSDVTAAIIDPAQRLGPGLAFGACEEMHLLNVPAGKMSAFPEAPLDFVDWLNKHHSAGPHASISPDAFVSRRLFGDYIAAALDQARHQSSVPFTHLRADAAAGAAESGGIRLTFSDGTSSIFDRIVLALGNTTPTTTHRACRDIADSSRYIHDIWRRPPWRLCAPADDVFIIGTGLTAIDAIIALRRGGHRGKITAISRRGLIPSVHLLGASCSPFLKTADSPQNLRQIVRLVRAEVRRARELGLPWQAVLDSLRASTPALWAGLTLPDQRRFLRHIKSYWETNRHRLAPELYAEIEALAASGALTIRAANLIRVSESSGRFRVVVRGRKSAATDEISADWIVNCSGPDGPFNEAPLLQSLTAAGLIAPDALSLGIKVAPQGWVIDAAGAPSQRILALGGLLKGSRWETTAVPEIRSQCAEAAHAILRSLP